MSSIAKIINNALTGLNPRQKEVLTARFGLEKGDEGETLAAIGERMHVTRERVRQIENGAISLVKTNMAGSDEATAVIERIKKFISTKGGVAKKGDVAQFASTLANGIRESHLDFLAEATGAFHLYREDENYHPFYYVSEKEMKTAQNFVDGWVGFLKNRRDKVFAEAYHAQLASFLKAKSVNQPIAENYLATSKKIHKNPYGDMGLRDWPEISPATVRDKIYLVLKKKGEPLHFEDIAKHINQVGFDEQEALAPTVHNELIKDERFVLVGRGMYGLREHGYEPGTARQVISKILKNRGPLRPTDVVTRVNEERFFKPNTILINLQNKNYFERMPDGRYKVRES